MIIAELGLYSEILSQYSLHMIQNLFLVLQGSPMFAVPA